MQLQNSRRAATSRLASCIFVLAAVMAACSVRVFAAEIYIIDPVPNDPRPIDFTPSCNIMIDGKIQAGDAQKAEQKLEEFAARPEVAAHLNNRNKMLLSVGPAWMAFDGGSVLKFALCLNSDGGDLPEVLRMANLFRPWMRVVEAGDKCISACAILFMLGNQRVLAPSRYLHHAAKLGFHAPSLDIQLAPGQSLEPAEVTESYSRSVKTLREVLFGTGLLRGRGGTDAPADWQSDNQNGLDGPADQQRDTHFIGRGGEGRLPIDLFLAITSVAPSEVYWVKVAEAKHWDIEIYGMPAPKTLTKSMLTVACMDAIRTECERTGAGMCLGIQWGRWRKGQGSFDFRFDSRQPDKRAEKFGDIERLYEMNRATLWPLSGASSDTSEQLYPSWSDSGASSTFVQAFRMTNRERKYDVGKRRPVLCEVIAKWENDRLVWLGIGAPPGGSFEIGPLHSSLPLWKMFPAGMTLDDIGTQGWGWLEEGGNFFDKPPNLGAP